MATPMAPLSYDHLCDGAADPAGKRTQSRVTMHLTDELAPTGRPSTASSGSVMVGARDGCRCIEGRKPPRVGDAAVLRRVVHGGAGAG